MDDGRTATLTVDLQPGERVAFDGPAQVEFVVKSGRVARLRVTAARHVRIKKVLDLSSVLVPSTAASTPS